MNPSEAAMRAIRRISQYARMAPQDGVALAEFIDEEFAPAIEALRFFASMGNCEIDRKAGTFRELGGTNLAGEALEQLGIPLKADE